MHLSARSIAHHRHARVHSSRVYLHLRATLRSADVTDLRWERTLGLPKESLRFDMNVANDSMLTRLSARIGPGLKSVEASDFRWAPRFLAVGTHLVGASFAEVWTAEVKMCLSVSTSGLRRVHWCPQSKVKAGWFPPMPVAQRVVMKGCL